MNFQVIIFINRISGGGFGLKVKDHIKNRNDIFIVTLPDDPNSWKNLDKDLLFNPKLKIIVCGGDGTVNWVVTMLSDFFGKDKDCYRPPLSIIPLGTGNDLSNMLGWGHSFELVNLPSVNSRISKICEKEYITKNVDVWKVIVNGETEKKKENTMLNYFSIGIDAEIAQEFAQKREKSPQLFSSHIASKFMYVPVSLSVNDKKLLNSFLSGYYIDKNDSQIELKFEKSSKTFVCQAITKIYGGKDLWKSKDRAVDDGMFEVIQTGGVFHLAVSQMGIKYSSNIGNAKKVFLQTNESVVYQVDGEPFKTDGPSTFLIERIGSYPMLFTHE